VFSNRIVLFFNRFTLGQIIALGTTNLLITGLNRHNTVAIYRYKRKIRGGTELSKIGNTILAWGYKLLADRGNAEAQYTLGIMYYTGKKVIEDKKEAMRRYKIAANQGYAPAQHLLGLEYALGKVVPKDTGEAVRWVKLSADQGYPKAKCLLAGYYLYGVGIPKDLIKAKQLAREGFEAGEESCKKVLDSVMFGDE
jgi:hypothetical protein